MMEFVSQNQPNGISTSKERTVAKLARTTQLGYVATLTCQEISHPTSMSKWRFTYNMHKLLAKVATEC